MMLLAALAVLVVVLLAIDAKAQTRGLLSILGFPPLALVCFVLFGMFGEPAFQFGRVPPSVMVVPLVCVVGFFLFCAHFGVKAHQQPLRAGREALLGKHGTARSDVGERGLVFADGTLWTAESVGGTIPAGADVAVAGMDGLRLLVRRVP